MVAPEFGKIGKEKKRVKGEILHMDGFGNVETKIAEKYIEGIRVSHGSSLKVIGVQGKSRFARARRMVKLKSENC